MDSYSVQAVLSVKDKNFTSGMTNASNVMAGIDSSAQKSSKSAGALGTAFAVANKVISGACNVIKSSVTDAVARVDTLNNYPKIMEQMGFTSESAEKSIQKLSDGIQGLPTSLDSIVSSAQNIALITGNLDEATDVALALNDAFLASGASTEAAERGVEAYDKMLSTGKVNSQNWMTLQQNMGYALTEVAKRLGIASGSTSELYDAMQSGEITFDDFNQALIECDTCTGGFAETASVACDGIATSWENVKTAVVRGVANMIQAWNDAANDNGIPTIQNSLHTLQNVVDTCFTAASKVITVFVKNLDTIVSACVPVVAGIASLKIIQTVSKQFSEFKDKAKESVKVLQDYTPKAEKVATATEKMEKAEKMVKTATEKQTEAEKKAFDALGKKQDAESKLEAADKKRAEATEKAKNATDDDAKAVAEAQKATVEYNEASEEAAKAAKEWEDAEKSKSQAEQEAAAATEYEASAQQEAATAIEGTSVKAIAHSAVMNVMTGAMKPAEAAVKAFNAACDANPLMMVITAVTTVVSAMKGLESALKKAGIWAEDCNDKWKDLKDSMDDMNDSLEDNNKSMETNVDNLAADKKNVEQLWGQVKTLAEKEELSADQSERLNEYIWQLNDAVPGLGLAIDDATGKLNQSADAVDAYIEAWEKLDELSVITENYNTALENQKMVSEELKYAQDQYNESMDLYTSKSGGFQNCTFQNMIALLKQKNAVSDLQEQEDEYTAISESLARQRQETTVDASQALADAYNYEVEALQQAVEDNKISYEQLSEANQQTVDDMKSGIDDLASSMTDGTQSIVQDLDTTRDEYLKTEKENFEAVEEWGNNMETLRDRMEGLGLDTSVLDQWAEVPDEGIPLAAMFVEGSDEELAQLAEYASTDTEEAGDAMLKAWGVTGEEIPDAIREYITDPTGDSIAEQLRDIDWGEPSEDLMENLWDSMASSFDNLDLDELGIDIVDGVAVGMEDTSSIDTSSSEVASDTEDYLRDDFDANSPSGMTEDIGEDLDEGLAKGIRAAESVVENAIKRIVRTVEQTFNSLGSSTQSGVNKMTSAFTSGMNTMKSTSSTGMNAIKSSMTSGMSSITTTVTSGMNSVKSAMSSGFQSMTSTVKSQMSNIRSAFSSGMSNIKSTVSSGMNTVKSTLTNAMNSCVSSVRNGANNMASAMSSGMNGVISAARSAASSVISAFSGLYNSLYNSGVNAMVGLQNGMNSRRSSVQATANSIANSVSSTINSALRIGSPSKVLKKTGQYAGEGLVLGLKDMLGDVKDMAGEMADAVNTMVFGAFDSPKLAFAGGMDMNVNYEYSNADMLDKLDGIRDVLDEDRSFEFTIPFEVDGKEFARATATYTQDELNKVESRNSRRQQFSIGG